MEFHCDRCGTRYTTTQAVREAASYQYKCRICRHTVFVRIPGTTPPGARARGGIDERVPRDLRPPRGLEEDEAAPAAPERASPPPLPVPPVAPKDPDPFAAFVGSLEQPPPRDDIVLRFDDEPPRTGGDPSFGAVTVSTPTPVRKTIPPAPSPRPRPSFRPADGPNRAAREGTGSISLPLDLARRQLGKMFGAGGQRPWRKLSERQRFAATLAVFTVTTAAAMAIGIAVAGKGAEASVSPASPAPRVGALAQVGAGGFAAPTGSLPALPPATGTPPPRAAAATPGVPSAAPVREPAPRPAVPSAAAVAALPDPARAPLSTESMAPPAVRPPPAEPPRASRPTRAAEPPPRHAASHGGRGTARGGARAATAKPGAPHGRERVTAASSRTARGAQRVASAAPAPGGGAEPVVPSAGSRHPSPATPGCVQQGIRLPSRWADRRPGSVLLRFAVGLDGIAEMIETRPGPDRAPGARVEADIAEALTAAVRACRFSPGADAQGRPVRMWMTMKVKFAG